MNTNASEQQTATVTTYTVAFPSAVTPSPSASPTAAPTKTPASTANTKPAPKQPTAKQLEPLPIEVQETLLQAIALDDAETVTTLFERYPQAMTHHFKLETAVTARDKDGSIVYTDPYTRAFCYTYDFAQYAARLGKCKCLEALVKLGYDVNHRSILTDYTLGDHAVFGENFSRSETTTLQLVALLTRYGHDWHAKSKRDRISSIDRAVGTQSQWSIYGVDEQKLGKKPFFGDRILKYLPRTWSQTFSQETARIWSSFKGWKGWFLTVGAATVYSFFLNKALDAGLKTASQYVSPKKKSPPQPSNNPAQLHPTTANVAQQLGETAATETANEADKPAANKGTVGRWLAVIGIGVLTTAVVAGLGYLVYRATKKPKLLPGADAVDATAGKQASQVSASVATQPPPVQAASQANTAPVATVATPPKAVTFRASEQLTKTNAKPPHIVHPKSQDDFCKRLK